MAIQYVTDVSIPQKYDLSGGVILGNQLIEAVRICAPLVQHCSYHEVMHEGRKMIGRESEYSENELVIMVGFDNQTYIHPEAGYGNVKIMYHRWPGVRYSLGFTKKDVVSSIEIFRENLEKVLREMVQNIE